MYGKSKLYFSNISLVGAESAPTFTIWGRKAPPRIQKWLHFTPPFFEIWNLNKITMKSEHKKRRRKAQINFARNIENGIDAKTEFDCGFYLVFNMIVKNGKMILGVDKAVVTADLQTKEINAYTPLSVEAEKHIIGISR